MAYTSSERAIEKSSAPSDVERDVCIWGQRIFELMDAAEAHHWFSKKNFYRSLMDWAMHDERFKTQLFRFVDVLPSLHTSAEFARHLREYLGNDEVKLSAPLRLALRACNKAPWLSALAIRRQVIGLARQFMLGNDEREIVATLRQLHEQKLAFTVDLLGETVMSEAEANQYAARCLALMDLLARETAHWSPLPESAQPTRGPATPLNVSVKISALSSQIHPSDPEGAIERISVRLRPILRRARELGAFINFDMEQHSLKPLTLHLFQTLFEEVEFSTGPACGLALQAYLKDSERDLHELLSWGRAHPRRLTIRLVKGAYWDYEQVVADQKGWPVPVFENKAETDANFERLSVLLLENAAIVEPAFGTHNVRSIAHALAQSERLGVPGSNFEFQMLYGMADSTKRALVDLGYRVREYCPVGDLLPGMAYLVRRLLENTSNEGFLAKNYARTASRDELLRSPLAGGTVSQVNSAGVSATRPLNEPLLSIVSDNPAVDSFRNEPPADFTIPAERDSIRAALKDVRGALGQKHPLIVNHRAVETADWLPSLNPANQNEVIGFAAQGTIAEAEAALAAAQSAWPKWARTPPEERAQIIERVAHLLRRERARLSALEILEAGKNWNEADADVIEAIDFCDFYAKAMRQLGRLHTTQPVLGESNVQHWWPRGTGLVIAPWNFPLAILTGMTVAAVVTGNAVVVKPSDQTPIIAARFMALLMEAGLPPGVVNLLMGPGSSVGAHLVGHPKVDFIAFTGSKEVGLRIWETAGRTLPGQTGLKKVVCEMGGKNAVIIDDDADLDEAVAGTVVSAFGYQGQKCSALSRLIVLSGCYDRFLERLISAAASLQVGPAEDPGAPFGPVIGREAQQRILKAIEAGKKEATLAWQGQVPADPNACYVAPTIFTDVPPSSRLFREEIFGPVLSISKARDFDEALALANTSEFALTGGIYSRSPSHIERAKSEFECGNLYINRTITGAIVERQPFGGFKMSGGGTKAGGPEYLHNFMVPRVVTENTLRRGFAPPEKSPRLTNRSASRLGTDAHNSFAHGPDSGDPY